ncbi:MAG: PIN domain-containing protein [Alphaproteobacteria bacterium]|nr:PIN domain-containing protein [Alphaproteobacteria bacterium]MBU0797631.1 PIN domain-containing protein [Alphaproteobacteria bacterium]MBU0887505.1 PIN domain-containing protein [Alphaproteobacteria bacterium]MBU1814742.1 PIN domain-containing protein [Alphaproteobacteria bacterium]
MDAYLLDTTILSIYLDPGHPHHAEKSHSLAALPAESPRFISAVALGELGFGVKLAAVIGKGNLPALEEMLVQARSHAVIDISHHTASLYAEIKARIAQKYLAKVLRKDRPKYIEEWVDKATGQKLGIDENDLWMCAQAKERDLIFVTADGKMKRIPDADPDVRLLTI